MATSGDLNLAVDNSNLRVTVCDTVALPLSY
jgi:hypothetical protein